jgi:hypothetical protein
VDSMRRFTGFRKTPSELSQSAHRQLNMYALAASAAGVGALALAQTAEAKVVYTPAHHVIGRNTIFRLDLNHDGKTDFTLGYRYFSTNSGLLGSVYAFGPQGNRVEGTIRAGGGFLAAALNRGARVPNRRRFSQENARMAYVCGGLLNYCLQTVVYSGNWFNVTNRYLGLKFRIDGKIHFGWARLSIQWVRSHFSATLTGYAYETIPNKAVFAGKTNGQDDAFIEETKAGAIFRALDPAILGGLALGAPGLSARRRRKPSANVQ